MFEFRLEFWDEEFENDFPFYKIKIKSLMCFPLADQEKKRNGYCAGLISELLDSPLREAYLNKKNVSTLDLEKFCRRSLKEAPAFSDLHPEAHRNFQDAGIAGECLQGVWQFQQSSPNEHVGVAKARYMLVDLPAGEAQNLLDRKVESCWQKYKCVAHLHAARRFHSRTRSKRQLDLGFLHPGKLLEFLACAKQLEDFATTHIHKHGQQVPLISKDEIWSIETNFPLPSVDLKVRPPHSEVKKLMRKYKSRNEL